MWILNQDKDQIINSRGIVVIEIHSNLAKDINSIMITVDWVGEYKIGQYSTREKAIKVLNKILDILKLDIDKVSELSEINSNIIHDPEGEDFNTTRLCNQKFSNLESVFEMPKDEEVE